MKMVSLLMVGPAHQPLTETVSGCGLVAGPHGWLWLLGCGLVASSLFSLLFLVFYFSIFFVVFLI
jgi:hypothetical protein